MKMSRELARIVSWYELYSVCEAVHTRRLIRMLATTPGYSSAAE